MNALEWLTEIHGFENLVKEDANLVEEYHKYRKSVEVCENCNFWVEYNKDKLGDCTKIEEECIKFSYGCNSWKEKQQ